MPEELTKAKAVELAAHHIGKKHLHFYDITDKMPENLNIYNRQQYERDDCWYIRYSIRDPQVTELKSTNLMGVSKKTGEILFDISMNDEG